MGADVYFACAQAGACLPSVCALPCELSSVCVSEQLGLKGSI